MSDILAELFSLRGKTALVTGGGGAIGRVLSRALALAGARVLIHDVDPERLATARALVKAAGAEAETIVADVRDPAAIKTLVDTAAA